MMRMAILVAACFVFGLFPLLLLRLMPPPRWTARLAFIALLGMLTSIAVLLAAVLVPEVLVMSGVRELWQTCSMAFQAIGAHPLGRAPSIVAAGALGIVLARFGWTFVCGVRASRRARVRGEDPAWRLER